MQPTAFVAADPGVGRSYEQLALVGNRGSADSLGRLHVSAGGLAREEPSPSSTNLGRSTNLTAFRAVILEVGGVT